VAVGGRGDRPPIDGVERQRRAVLVEDLLDHERVHISQRRLQEVKAEHGDFLVIGPVGGDVALFAEVDEPFATQ
jgi:hypothetical protein